ncbi:hypothetical protein EVAR_93197_1 [Eumeta japonica]|uniref:Uncharacterized protein n=1 Tax=Eumeta variegata TaxID=151549 RepID=A0A4C1TXK0_EUMVA|nr:hypothetical protein EVAR_93197_1 [Eumeta japonica]
MDSTGKASPAPPRVPPPTPHFSARVCCPLRKRFRETSHFLILPEHQYTDADDFSSFFIDLQQRTLKVVFDSEQ